MTTSITIVSSLMKRFAIIMTCFIEAEMKAKFDFKCQALQRSTELYIFCSEQKPLAGSPVILCQLFNF